MAEEEKSLQSKAQKKPTGKKAKQYDAAEAQKQALLKTMQKMMIGAQPEEGVEAEEAGIIEEVVAADEVQASKEEVKHESRVEEVKDKHPEKRMKAAFKRFEEERLPELKEEYPTLKHSQLQEKLFKEVCCFYPNILAVVEEESFEPHELSRRGTLT
jgi:hypothetical protein